MRKQMCAKKTKDTGANLCFLFLLYSFVCLFVCFRCCLFVLFVSAGSIIAHHSEKSSYRSKKFIILILGSCYAWLSKGGA